MTVYMHYMKAKTDKEATDAVKYAVSQPGVLSAGFSLGFSSAASYVILTMPEGADPHSVLPDMELERSVSLDDLLAEQKAEDTNNNDEQPEQI